MRCGRKHFRPPRRPTLHAHLSMSSITTRPAPSSRRVLTSTAWLSGIARQLFATSSNIFAARPVRIWGKVQSLGFKAIQFLQHGLDPLFTEESSCSVFLALRTLEFVLQRKPRVSPAAVVMPRRTLRLLLLLLIPFICGTGWNDFEQPIGDGFSIGRANPSDVRLCHEGNALVGSHGDPLVAYSVTPTHIFTQHHHFKRGTRSISWRE